MTTFAEIRIYSSILGLSGGYWQSYCCITTTIKGNTLRYKNIWIQESLLRPAISKPLFEICHLTIRHPNYLQTTSSTSWDCNIYIKLNKEQWSGALSIKKKLHYVIPTNSFSSFSCMHHITPFSWSVIWNQISHWTTLNAELDADSPCLGLPPHFGYWSKVSWVRGKYNPKLKPCLFGSWNWHTRSPSHLEWTSPGNGSMSIYARRATTFYFL